MRLRLGVRQPGSPAGQPCWGGRTSVCRRVGFQTSSFANSCATMDSFESRDFIDKLKFVGHYLPALRLVAGLACVIVFATSIACAQATRTPPASVVTTDKAASAAPALAHYDIKPSDLPPPKIENEVNNHDARNMVQRQPGGIHGHCVYAAIDGDVLAQAKD